MTNEEYEALYGSSDVSEAERITNALTPLSGLQLARMDEDAEYEAFYLREQQAANEQYAACLKRDGITEEEHLAEIMDWCDRQD